MRRLWFLLIGLSVGCSSSPLMLPQRPTLLVRSSPLPPARPRGIVYRDEVVRAVQTGLGHFLQRVEVRAVTRPDDAGRRAFVGFEVVALRPAADWLAFDFAPGDILTKLDGVSVEHYDSVIPWFEGLVAKDQFEVSLVRAGEPMTVVIRIRDRQTMPGAQ